MRNLKIVLIVIYLAIVFPHFSYAGEALKEQMKRTMREYIIDAYQLGLLANSSSDCYEDIGKIRERIIALGLEWSHERDLLSKIAVKACLLGYKDKNTGIFSLPLVLKKVDEFIDSYFLLIKRRGLTAPFLFDNLTAFGKIFT